MKKKFILNVIHRPELVPEYAEKVTGHGKEEDISRKGLLRESNLDLLYNGWTAVNQNYATSFGVYCYGELYQNSKDYKNSVFGRYVDCIFYLPMVN